MKKPIISIVMGSDSDLSIMQECASLMDEFNVPFEMKIMSAHRTPDDVAAFSKNALQRGIKVIVAGAGGAAHLAGVIASKTILPVIGVPLEASSLKGLDALLATVQMPVGIPVATVAIGKAGAINAGLLALQIVALGDKRIKTLLQHYKIALAKKVRAKNKKLQKSFS